MCDKQHYDALEERVTNLECEVSQLRNETRTGFEKLDSKFDAMIVPVLQEKVKWGDVLRDITKWIIRTILIGCLAAMGITLYDTIFR